jgi:hypothetical protein
MDPNDYDVQDNDKMLDKKKRMDRAYNVIYRKALRKDGRKYDKKIEIYTSGGTGSRIRDAESGEYLNYIVGSRDEDLFFKTALATGECKSANGSNTLFYASPQHYANHLQITIDPQTVSKWEKKRDARLATLKSSTTQNRGQ